MIFAVPVRAIVEVEAATAAEAEDRARSLLLGNARSIVTSAPIASPMPAGSRELEPLPLPRINQRRGELVRRPERKRA